jgi:small subunit ribosomal protein S14
VAKTSKLEKNKKITRLIAQHKVKRAQLKKIISDPNSSHEERYDAVIALQKLPRNASSVRTRNRCGLTGRPRGYLRRFNLCRIAFRDLALEGKIPGVTKSSW